MLDGLFDTLATKVTPQYNETIKSLLIWYIYWVDGENIEEWMRRLHVHRMWQDQTFQEGMWKQKR